jgi:nitrite reductase/ring-hydroxylating ferredoxin subunit
VVLAVLLLALPAAFLLRTFLGGWQAVMSVDALEAADVAYIRNAGVFLVRTDGGPIALSAASPHLDHRLLYCRSNSMFQGEHGEVFDRAGFYVDGPAHRGMDRVAVRVQEGVIQIDADDVRRGPPPGAGPAAEPVGRFCEVPGPEPRPGFAADPTS